MVPAGSAIARNPVVNTLKPQNPSYRPIRHLKKQNALSGSKAARRAAANPAHPAVSRLPAHRKTSLFPLSSPLTLAPSLISCPFSHLRRTASLPVFSRLSLYWIYQYPRRRLPPPGFAGMTTPAAPSEACRSQNRMLSQCHRFSGSAATKPGISGFVRNKFRQISYLPRTSSRKPLKTKNLTKTTPGGSGG